MLEKVTSKISELCFAHTDLSQEEITFLEDYSLLLRQDATLNFKDIFIDVKDSYSDEGLVVFHKIPDNGKSIYENEVVGKLAFRKDEPGVLRTLETGNRSCGLFAQTQEGKIIEQDVIPIHFRNRLIAVLITEQIVSKHVTDTFSLNHSVEGKKASVKRKDHREQKEVFTTSIEIPINILEQSVLLFDMQGSLLYYNKIAEELYRRLGYFNTIDQLSFDNLTLANENFDKIALEIDTTKALSTQKVVLLNGMTYLQHTIYLEDKNQILLLVSQLKKSTTSVDNHANDYFEIQEIHHRVKNNLQSIISILRLQARRVKSQEAKHLLQESINRVMSIAATHELLSRQKSDQVNLSSILSRVLENLNQAYSSFGVFLTYDLKDSIVISSDIATTISLVTTEIVQNAYEHAFTKEVSSPKIQVLLTRKNALIVLEIRDNGIGFDRNGVGQKSLGMQLINALVSERLKGECVIDSKDNKGTIVRITF